MHALFMFLSALSTLLLVLAWQSQGRAAARKYGFAYALTTLLNLYTMYFAFLILVAQGAMVVSYQLSITSLQKGEKPHRRVRRGRRENRGGDEKSGLSEPLQRQSGHSSRNFFTPAFSALSAVKSLFLSAESSTSGCRGGRWRRRVLPVGWLAAVGGAMLAYLPWWPVLLRLVAFRARVGAVEGGVGPAWAFLPRVVAAIGPSGGGAWLFFALYWVGLGAAWRRHRSTAVLGGLWLLLPALLPLLAGDPRGLHVRYAFVLPVYLLMVSLGVETLVRQLRPHRRAWGASLAMLALAGLSAAGVRDVYALRKPDWRGAAAFVAAQAGPNDVVVSGPLWDDGRFFGYYYPHPERVMSPPVMVSRLPELAAEMSESGGRLWLVTRHTPAIKRFAPHPFYGVTVLEQTESNYDPVWMVNVGAELCKKAARAADEWAAAMEADGVLNPDARSSRAAAWLCQGDTFVAAGDPERALEAYRKMVESFPGWAGGYATLAQTYVAVDNLPAAAEAFALAVRYNPAWQGAQAEEAARLARAGDFAAAVAVYQAVVGQ